MVDKRLCIGMFILGMMSYHDNEEIQKDKHLQYIAKTLHKVHFPLKNGSAKDRFNKNIKALIKSRILWQENANIADKVWQDTARKLSTSNYITVSAFIFFLLERSPETKSFYGFNDKKIKAFEAHSEHRGKHSFAAMRTVSLMMKNLDFEIAQYNQRMAQNAKQNKISKL